MAKAKAKEKEAVEPTSLSSKALISDFNKRFGEGTFFTFSDTEKVKVVPVSSGIPSFDYASGIGGYPLGRLVELYGPESSGKTTVALKAIATFQEAAKNPNSPFYGKRAAFIDAENALDPIHVAALGVDVSEETGVLINQPDSGEQAYDLMEAICHSGQFAICVVDSIASLVPLKETQEDMSYNPIALQARMNSQGLRKLKGPAHKNNVLFIFINQLRTNPGQMFGNPEVTPGGKALKFYASMRIDVRRKEIKKSDVVLGQTITTKIVKNKVSRPFTKAEFDYYWDTGIDITKDIMEVAMETDVIKRAGAYYYLGESYKNPAVDHQGNQLTWMGKDSLLEVLRTSPGLFKYINDMVLGYIPKDAQFVDESPEEEELTEEEALLVEEN